MGADKLVYVFAKHKVAYLRVSLHALRLMTVNCVPESDASVSRATATGKKSLLVGRPGKSLYSCFVARELPLWVGCVCVMDRPDHKFVVITP